MKFTVSFRKAIADDRSFLLKLRKASMNNHLIEAGIIMNDEIHLKRIDEFFNDSYIICQNERSVGLIKFAVKPYNLHIRQFQIIPEYQGRGIGGYVLNVLKKKAKERALPITLNVLLKNPALKLYQRHGFVIEGENELEYQMRYRCNY